MQAAQTLARTKREERAQTNVRKCLVTGETKPKNDLIRFAVGPDDVIVPDLAQSLPGRGLWVTAERALIEEAARKNLFGRAAKSSVKVAKDLADQVATLLQKRCLDLLGLARGAGITVLGQPQVEEALKKGKIALLLIAPDAKADLKNGTAMLTHRFTRDELSAALGHNHLAYVGLKAHGLTDKLRHDLMRLDKITLKDHIEKESEIGNS